MKRTADSIEESDSKKLKMEGDDGLIEIRCLIDNYEASVIIGKAGSNVKRIREESSAFVSILRNDYNAKERVLTLKGTVEYIAHASELVTTLLLETANARKEGQESDESVCLKILHHKTSAGAIIGKGGAIIREIQETTGVRMSLSVETLGASTEKSCSISGTPEQIRAAVSRVVTQLSENPLRPGTHQTLYVPGAPVGPPASPYGAPPPGYGPPGGYPPHSYGAPPPAAGGYYAPPPGGAPPKWGGAQTGPQKTEKIVIPTVCAGTVIGKGGSIIRDIKTQSGTVVTIADPEPTAPADRVVSITGTSHGIQTAISLIRHRVESYTPPPTV